MKRFILNLEIALVLSAITMFLFSLIPGAWAIISSAVAGNMAAVKLIGLTWLGAISLWGIILSFKKVSLNVKKRGVTIVDLSI